MAWRATRCVCIMLGRAGDALDACRRQCPAAFEGFQQPVRRIGETGPPRAAAQDRRKRLATSCPTASACSAQDKPGAGKTPSPIRCAKSVSGPGTAKSCAFCVTTSMPAPMKSPNSTNAAGRSNCSSAGSSSPEDKALPRHQRERRTHPDRCRADRLRVVAPRPDIARSRSKPTRLRAARQGKSHAQKTHRPAPRAR